MNKELLTEENYERGKKKVKTIALIVLVIGLLIGGCLITTGIIKSSNSASKEDIQAEIDTLNSELATLRAKQSQNFFNNAFSEEYYRLENEIETKESRLRELKMKSNDTFSNAKSIPFYMFGGIIIFASCMFSGITYLSTKQREILAYHAQQVMPVAKEGMEKVAPTLGKVGASIAKEMAPAYGDIAKEISKGIKDGLKDEDKK